MIRILAFVVLVFALAFGFSWLADRPGDLVITWQNTRYEVSLLVAATALAALVAAIMLGWWLVKTLVRSPMLLQRHFRARKRDRGYQAISTGMIAAGAGDSELARRMTKQASKLLSADQEPLIKLLDAQAAVLERRNDDARALFEDMSNDPETRLLGLRGLYMEAERLGEREAARHYALKAAELAPQLQWAANVALEDKLVLGDFDGAIKLLDGQKSLTASGKASDKRRRAVLLAGKAIALFDRDMAAAKAASMEANRLAPDLVPATVTLAKCLFKAGDLRKGSGVIEAAWKIAPHPELAQAYVHARLGDSPEDRLRRARKLASVHSHSPESHLALSRALLDARDFAEAKKEAEAAIAAQPGESTYLLLADIEQASGGSQGAIKALLSKAVRAQPDAAWTADGMVSTVWGAFSPISGRIDAFEWKVPLGRLQPLIELEPETPEPEAAFAAPGAAETMPPIASAPKPQEAPMPVAVNSNAAIARKTGAELVAAPPDDPGVRPEYLDEKPKSRFRLF